MLRIVVSPTVGYGPSREQEGRTARETSLIRRPLKITFLVLSKFRDN
jgi:hypothetical protein